MIILKVTEIFIAPFPKVKQIKGALQKVEKAVYKKHSKINIFSVLFFHSISLNKMEELLTPTLETESEKKTKKAFRKYQQKSKQGSIEGENKTSSK